MVAPLQGPTTRDITKLAVAMYRIHRQAAISKEGRRFLMEMDRLFRDAINESFKSWADETFMIPWISRDGSKIVRRVRLRDFLDKSGQRSDYERLIENAAATMMGAAKKQIGKMAAGWQAHLDPGRDKGFIEDVVMETLTDLLGKDDPQKSIWNKAKRAAYKAFDEAVRYALSNQPASPPTGAGVNTKVVKDIAQGVDKAVESVVLDETKEAARLALAGLRKAIQRYAQQQIGKPKKEETPEDLWDKVEPLTEPNVLKQFLYQIHELKAANKSDWDKVVERAADVLSSLFLGAFSHLRVRPGSITREAWESANKYVRGRLGPLFRGERKNIPTPVMDMLQAMSPVIHTRKEALEKVFQRAGKKIEEQLYGVFNFAYWLGASIKNRTSNAIRKLQALFSFKEGAERAYFQQDEAGEDINVLGMIADATADAAGGIDAVDWLRRGDHIEAGGRRAKIIPFIEWAATTSPKVKKRKSKQQYRFVLRYLELMMHEDLGSGIPIPSEPVPDRQIVNHVLEHEGQYFGDPGRSTLFRWAKQDMPQIFNEYDEWRKSQRIEFVTERRDYWRKERSQVEKQLEDAKKKGDQATASRAQRRLDEINEEISKADKVLRMIQSSADLSRAILAGALIVHTIRWHVPPRTMIASRKEVYGGLSPVAIQIDRVLRSVFA